MMTSHAAAMATNVQGGAMRLHGAVGCHGAAGRARPRCYSTRAVGGCFNHFRCTTQRGRLINHNHQGRNGWHERTQTCLQWIFRLGAFGYAHAILAMPLLVRSVQPSRMGPAHPRAHSCKVNIHSRTFQFIRKTHARPVRAPPHIGSRAAACTASSTRLACTLKRTLPASLFGTHVQARGTHSESHTCVKTDT